MVPAGSPSQSIRSRASVKPVAVEPIHSERLFRSQAASPHPLFAPSGRSSVRRSRSPVPFVCPTLALSCGAPAPIEIIAVPRQLQRLVRRHVAIPMRHASTLERGIRDAAVPSLRSRTRPLAASDTILGTRLSRLAGRPRSRLSALQTIRRSSLARGAQAGRRGSQGGHQGPPDRERSTRSLPEGSIARLWRSGVQSLCQQYRGAEPQSMADAPKAFDTSTHSSQWSLNKASFDGTG